MKFRLGLNGIQQAQQHVADGFGGGMRALFMSPLLAAQAAGEGRKDEAQIALHAAQKRQADAHTALFGQQAEAARQQTALGDIGEQLKTAYLMHGGALPDAPDAVNYFRTGQLPAPAGAYQPMPEDQAGPVLPTPKYIDPKLAEQVYRNVGLLRGSLGNGGTIEAVTKAGGELQDQDVMRQAAESALAGDDMTMSRLNAVRGKQQFMPYRAVGNTGTSLNQVTGDQPVTNPTMNTGFNSNVAAQTFQHGAAGQASQAQVRHSDAGTAKLKAETDKLLAVPESGLPAGVTPDAIEAAAARYNVDGTMPPLGMGKDAAAMRALILNRAAALSSGISGSDQRVGQIGNKADGGALAALSKQFNMVSSFEKTANANATLALDLSNRLDRTNVPIFNKWIQAGRTGTGSPEAAQFHAANQTFVNEYAKIMSGSMGNTPVSDAARAHANELLSTAQSQGQYAAVVDTLRSEMSNRMKGFAEQEAELRARLGGRPAPAAQGDGAAAAPTGAPAAAPRAAGGQPFKLSTKPGEANVQYERLPSGSEFIAPDGSRRRKP